MRTLVVVTHPVAESFCHAVAVHAVATLERGGHEVRTLDLYALDFDPRLTRAERLDYYDEAGNGVGVAEHVDHLRWAEALVFVHPTWWYGPPAMLKGWLDRVLLPGVAFTMGRSGDPIAPGLTDIRRLALLTTYGAPWWLVRLVGDPGRKMLLRGIRAVCARRCRTLFVAHHHMDTSTPASRAAFLRRVERALTRV